MRMDNETYGMKVESLLVQLTREGGNLDSSVADELRTLALTPRRSRYFLRALLTTEQPESIQIHFYRHIMSQAKNKDAYSDLERHIRHAFYEAREQTKAVLSHMNGARQLQALFNVIALTEEGWLAGELIRLVLAMPVANLREPLLQALQSPDYLLQCLAIYLIGKTGDEELLLALAEFYRRPVGEQVERLEQKSYDALLEGAAEANADLFKSWLKNRSSRIRELALTVLATREVGDVVVDLASLVLIDAHTRTRAANVLLRYAENGVFAWRDDDPQAQAIAAVLSGAKEDALVSLLQSLTRDESPAVRETAVNFVGLLPQPADALIVQISRLSWEDPMPAVQMAALKTLERHGPDRLVPVLVNVYANNGFGKGSPELLQLANEIMERALQPRDVMKVQQGIEEKQQRRAEALEKFTGTVEWWRHDG